MFLAFYAKMRKRPLLMQFIGVPSGPRTSGLGPFDSLVCPQRVPSGTMPLGGVIRLLDAFKVAVFAKSMHMPTIFSSNIMLVCLLVLFHEHSEKCQLIHSTSCSYLSIEIFDCSNKEH
uniref:Uncharacterized protein n=1 Tax=Glossina pallidipes TaxID=7398 RepID=A0A1A9ZPZ6_GLOPL